MHISKDIWRKIALALAVLTFVILMFRVFVTRNERRILAQNAAYVAEAAEHTTLQTEIFLNRSQDSLDTVAYLFEQNMTSPEVDESILTPIVDTSSFSYVGLVDADGVNHTILGQPLNLSDRSYYQLGMQNQSGIDVVTDSHTTEDVLVLFYTPLHYEGKVIGVLIGYFEKDRLKDIFHTTYFGEEASTYLCLPDGQVVAASIPGGGSTIANILDSFFARPEHVGEEDAALLAEAFANRTAQGITYQGTYGTGNAYVTKLAGYDLMLFQTFPSGANRTMVESANQAGILLEAGLVLIFFIYILYLLLSGRHQRRRLVSEKDRELQYRDQLFSLLSQNSEDIYVLFDLDTKRSEYVSPNIQRLIGLDAEAVKADLYALVNVMSESSSIMATQDLRAIPVGSSIQQERAMLHQETQERRWYRETVYHTAFRGSDRFVLVLSDRTNDQKMKQTLENALETARSANQAKSNFLSNMSHDIRTPMNAIAGFATLLNKDADQPEKVREYTQKISASSQHLLSLINDVLDMSKIESGKTTLNVASFSLPGLLERVNTIIAPQAQAKKQRYEMQLRGEVPELLLGDELRVGQILVNLLSNAVKYTNAGGRIDFLVQGFERTNVNSVHLCFEVKDNGIGMSQEFLGQIFDPFTRETNSVINTIQGTGLGMTITRNLVHLMGGTIAVQSKLGQGSTFTVELEFVVPEQLRNREFWEINKISRALVVDDEEDICLAVLAQMEGTGVQVDYTTDGQTAVDMAASAYREQRGYDVILLDWKMPGMDGVETAKRIRDYAGPEVPILVLTAFDWGEIEHDARSAGINAFLSKPFFRTNFQHTIHTLRSQEASARLDEMPLEGMRFLAAEDNDLNAEILEELLSMAGARCERVFDGKEALERFLRSQPGEFDMILMDVQMPVMGGYEATRAIRACDHPLAKTIPIVAMTANAFAEDVKNALDSGMNAHVSKPVDLDELTRTLLLLKENKDRQ